METIQDVKTLIITSPAFASGESIPVRYTCEGENSNPPLSIKNIPSETKSLALIIEDPDASSGVFAHWVVWNIRPTETIRENTVPGTQGKNGFNNMKYQGPCPPSGTHRYFFKVYALDTLLNISPGSLKTHVEMAMKDHILAKGELMGLYHKAQVEAK
jgi:Raf kinase inhibitor-like YbhB/YbcL family protein